MPEPFRRFFQMPDAGGGATQQGLGSGFIIGTDGYILTNHHVINGADRITVRMNDRREFEADVVGSDARSDLALLKINASGLPTLHLANNDNLKVGEWVLAIGSPFGLDYSVAAGIVSAMGRSLPNERNENYVPFIQTDVAINPGNSGGPLFNLDGEVVGINSQIYTRSGGSMGLSFAIPASVARNVVAQLKEHGAVERGWLGVSIQEVDKELAQSFGLEKPEGALVAQVVPDGPAERGGIESGDIITSFNGKPILFSSDLPHLVGEVTPDSRATLVLVRNGKQKTIDLTVGELPENGQRFAQRPSIDNHKGEVAGPLGLLVEELDDQQRKRMQLAAGLLIKQVKQGSAAAKAGLQAGDVIVQLGFSSVGNVASFQKVAAGLPIGSIQPIRFYRQGNPVFRSIVIE
jgi:serine protease Do